jgi:2-dehydro-3-deoxygluconokinase
MIRAICLGEAMIELRSAGPDLFSRAVAGDVYNTAVYMKRSFGAAAEIAFLTALGDDALSEAMRVHFIAQGLSDDLVYTVPGGLPGLYLIELDAEGDRNFHYWRSASAARRWLAELMARGGPAVLVGADLIYISGVSLAILSPEDRAAALNLLQTLKGQVGRIAFDPNIRPRLWPDLAVARTYLEALCPLADIILPSLADGEMIWGISDPERQLAQYCECGAAEVALTLGADGVRVRTDQDDIALAALPVTIKDTSGAGDSFNGAYLAARLQGADTRAAAKAGLTLAARVVALPGALPPEALSHPSSSPPEREVL